MTVTVLAILGFMVIVLLGGLILTTVNFSRTLQKSAEYADRANERSSKQINSLLDRLMAKTFADFKAYDLAENAETQVLEVPPAEDRPWDVPAVIRPGKGLAGGDKIVGEEEEM